MTTRGVNDSSCDNEGVHSVFVKCPVGIPQTEAKKLKMGPLKDGRSWFWLLEKIFVVYIDSKMLAFLALQVQYEILQANYPKSHYRVEEHRLLMRRFGVASQELGVVAILGFSIPAFCHLIFNHTDFSARILSIYKEDIYLLANRSPELADQRYRQALDKYLHELIELNDIERRTILCRFRSWVSISRDVLQLILTDLRAYQYRLRQLLYDKSTIWPPNRGARWREQQRAFALKSYIFIYLHTYWYAVIIIIIATYYANWKLVERGEVGLNFAERLFCVEFLFVTVTHKFMNSVVILLCKLRDHASYMKTIRGKFVRLNAMLLDLKYRLNLLPQQSCGDNSQTVNWLRSECDREALELYLILRVYLDHMKPSTRLINLVADQFSILILTMLVPTLPFYSSATSRGHMLLLAGVILDVGVFMNFIFLVAASFESICVKTLHKSWSLVACMTEEHPEEQREEQREAEEIEAETYVRFGKYTLRIQNSQETSLDPMNQQPQQQQPSIELLSEKTSKINGETALLWRRLLEDMPAIHNRFRCKVFNSITINYNGIVRINFWYISVILVFLTHF